MLIIVVRLTSDNIALTESSSSLNFLMNRRVYVLVNLRWLRMLSRNFSLIRCRTNILRHSLVGTYILMLRRIPVLGRLRLLMNWVEILLVQWRGLDIVIAHIKLLLSDVFIKMNWLRLMRCHLRWVLVPVCPFGRWHVHLRHLPWLKIWIAFEALLRSVWW